MSKLRQLMILTRDINKSTEFYKKGIGLEIIQSYEHFVEFDTLSGISLIIKQAENEASCTSGYSPFLNFDVKNMDELIPTLLNMGAYLDGPIQYPEQGKIAAVRSPDGNMIGLFESSSDT